ncbi:HNH endonuclease [Chitinimonas lacunae]|uniref:Putative HNH nuclease YajD n=1 Tax=Chitinimonas lacunae TaxID=1963018 RepID=A0ABV8MYA5_9NEIS
MAIAPKKPCARPGCYAIVDHKTRWCDYHAREEEQLQRDAARRRASTPEARRIKGMYDSTRWRNARVKHLTAHPWCVHCQRQGVLVPATEVDHITPHRGDWHLFLSPTNLQGLCKCCHSRKTATEDGGFGNAPAPRTPHL